MIPVDRSHVAKPKVLDSWAATQERHEAEVFFTDPKRHRQARFAFRVYRDPEVTHALEDLFHGKCAYCESKIDSVAALDVEMYRPKASVAERPEHPGYWWLASDWDNLLTSCVDCNRVRSHAGERSGKGSRFPLADEAKRAFAPGLEADEEPLLLNPCRDQPSEHLVFDEHGSVVSDTPRGQATISVLGLNRRSLVDARKRSVVKARSIVRALDDLLTALSPAERREIWRDDLFSTLNAELRAEVSDDAEYAGIKRQLLRTHLDRLRKYDLPDLRFEHASIPKVTEARKVQAKQGWGEYVAAQSSFTLENERGRETFKSQHRLIERVVIHNVKAIRDVDLDFTQVGSGRTPWRMFLGENGTGKSTVLQTIALTLIGAKSFARLGDAKAIHPRDYIRYRCKSGWVKVQMTGFSGPHMLTFREDHVVFQGPTPDQRARVRFLKSGTRIEGSGWQPQTIVLAYGATRLLPRSPVDANRPVGDDYSRVDNLFDPFIPVRDVDEWMRDLEPLQFDSATLVFKDLLRLAPSARFEVRGGRVMILDHGDRVPLQQLSDGYQSVLGTAADILEVMTALWPNLLDAEAIVILDEIGAHLHPTWKMRIVDSIRRAVPSVQFITSTHDPLCLRGLGAREVVVMQRDANDHVVAVTDLPSPADFRIEQLLTSSFFGLNSTSDPETDQDFTNYYSLLAMTTKTDDQEAELTRLTEKLKGREHLGTTPREQLMYRAVDQLIAEQKQHPDRKIADVQEEAVAKVAAIWARDTVKTS